MRRSESIYYRILSVSGMDDPFLKRVEKTSRPLKYNKYKTLCLILLEVQHE